MKVFEYGCGGSTIFFAHRVSEVISIEHDKDWFDRLTIHIGQMNLINTKLRNKEPLAEKYIEEIYTSDNVFYAGLSFENYVREIEQYPDNYFDIILIDGRARNACFLHSIPKVKKGGLVVWDNTERERYRIVFNSTPYSLKKIEVPGPTPFSMDFTATTIFIRE